jgi:hypothetical protein
MSVVVVVVDIVAVVVDRVGAPTRHVHLDHLANTGNLEKKKMSEISKRYGDYFTLQLKVSSLVL